MKIIKITLALLFTTLLIHASIESVTEIFVGFYDTNGIVKCGPLKQFQPLTPTNLVITITNR